MMHLVAHVEGLEEIPYRLRWQQSEDGKTWMDVADASEEKLDVVVTEDNYMLYWRVCAKLEEPVLAPVQPEQEIFENAERQSE